MAETTLPPTARRVLAAKPTTVGPTRSFTRVEAEQERFEAVTGWVDEADVREPRSPYEVPEELPPPIFSAILAAQTGKELSELRPDWTGPLPVQDEAGGQRPAPAEQRQKRSLGRTRRLGLGPPLPADPKTTPTAEEDRRDSGGEEPVPLEPPAAAEATDGASDYQEDVDAEPPVEAEVPASEPPRTGAVWYQTTTAPGAAHLERVPVSVRQDVTRAFGVDVGDLFVHRGPEVGEEAASIGARAYSRGGEIFVPLEAGDLDVPRVRALVAHELSHVAQRQVEDVLPDPDSPGGRRLEAEARSVERWARGDDPAPVLPPRRRLGASTGEPRVDAGGYVRGVTERLVAGPPTSDAFPAGQAAQTWRAEGDEGAADRDLQRALQEDLEASRRWAVDRQSASEEERARLDAEEQQRHHQFVEEYGARLGESFGGAPGTASSAGSGDSDFSPQQVAAHEGLFGMFREQGGVRGLDPGLGSLVGQFGRRDATEQDEIADRMEEYRRLTRPRRPGETPEEYQLRMEQVEAFQRRAGIRAPAQDSHTTSGSTGQARSRPTGTGAPATTAPGTTGPGTAASTTAPPAAATPAAATSRAAFRAPGADTPFEPASVAAHEGLLGMFREQGGARGLDPGVGALAAQFGRRERREQEETSARIDRYREVVGARRPGETVATYDERMEEVEAIQRRAAGLAPEPPSPAAATTTAPVAQATSPATTASTPATTSTATTSEPVGSHAPEEAPAAPLPSSGAVSTAVAEAMGGPLAAPAATMASHAAARPQGEIGAGGVPPDDVLSRLDEHDLEELAGMLYGRFRTRLRRELLIDRERSGLLTDFR